ncbi:histidine-rich glycoprotein [Haemorhous mexicanus]|uniref:histidine-rich glycoprotein n=1 Tax=Haemorhous mexicanus TaxID=30427 RepID=UPI0028BD6CC9|nr:histidine-rich glycoprotein [Haemorhous mexicanus]
MLLLASAFFLTLLQCSNAQNEISITPADCNTIETDAGVALDLVNRHRRDGYVFGLFRVADAHELHLGNSTVFYLTLDVLETECSVLSRRHWESCEYSDTYPMDFGQCKIITYTNHLLKKPQLYGFNCTLSPVPPDLIECKDCPVKLEALEVTEQHKDIAAKALRKFNSESNHTNNFAVDKVERVLKMTASREGHILGFSIKETNCSKSMQETDQALECDFLHDWHAHTGFCKARIISDGDEADGTDIGCEIYHPWHHGCGRRGKHSAQGHPHRHPYCHHHFGHRHRHKHHHRHECPPSSQSRPEDPEHNPTSSKEDQDSNKGHFSPPPPHDEPDHDHPTPPPHGPDHDHPPHHHRPPCPPPHGPDHDHPPHHHGPPCPPPHGPDHDHPPHHHGPPCPPPHGPDHDHPPHHHGPPCPPPHGPDHDHPPHHHGPPCPPPHGPDHDHPPRHHGPPCPPPHGPDHDHPPHHHGPPCPPPHGPGHHHPPHHHGPPCPPPHGPGHHHPPHHHGPPCPPPHGPGHHHPPHHHGPPCPPPPGHPPHHCHHYYRHHHNKTSISGKYFPCHVMGTVYRIPVLNQQDSLTPPTANFPELSQCNLHFSSTGSKLKEMAELPGFPDHPIQSKSCPGKPKLDLPKILPLFPHSFVTENSPI